MARLNLLYVALFFWTALVAASAVKLNQITQQGCYRGERPSHFAVAGSSRTEIDRRDCFSTCQRRGQPVVALGSAACFCTDDARIGIPILGNGRCNVNCVNGLNDNCIKAPEGEESEGEELFNVFRIARMNNDYDYEPFPFQPKPSTQNAESKVYAKNRGVIGKVTAQGCYQRMARPSQRQHIIIRDNMSRLACASFCASEGMPLALIGSACYCVKKYPRVDFVADPSSCYMPCFNTDDRKCQSSVVFRPAHRDFIAAYDTGLVEKVEIDGGLPHPEDTPTEISEPDQPPKRACYKAVPPNTLSKDFKHNSPKVCRWFCNRRRLKYSFTRNEVCGCSDTYPDKQWELPESLCNIQCPGNGLFACGGDNAYSVSNPEAPKKPTIEPQPLRQVERCFSELPREVDEIHLDSAIVTDVHESCLKQCRRTGNRVAFMQGFRCYCAEVYPRSLASKDRRECPIQCRGNANYSCGGRDGVIRGLQGTFSAYRTGYAGGRYRIAEEPAGPRLLQPPFRDPVVGQTTTHGCFSMKSATVTHKRPENHRNTVNACARYCEREGKGVAAVRGASCLCSHTYPMKSARLNDTKCDWKCPAALYQACGGMDAWSVVDTGVSMPLADAEPKTEGAPKIDKPKTDTSKTETPELPSHDCFRFPQPFFEQPHIKITRKDADPNGDSCIKQCSIKEYSMAFRRRNRCFCSNGLPVESTQIGLDKCSFISYWDKRRTGGPNSAYSVYRTGYDKSSASEKEENQKGDNPSTSLVMRPQCLHHGLERISEIASWIMTKIAEFAQNAWEAFSGFVDKAQGVFDACLWKVMVVFSDIIYSLGWVSSEGDVDL